MSKYIKLEDAIEVCRENQIIEDGATTGIRYPSSKEIIIDISELPTIEVSEDCISRQAAIEAICVDGTMFERQGQYSMTMAERKQRDIDILEALPSPYKGGDTE